MKIAVARHSEQPGATHFGYADTFDIYDIDTDPRRLVDVRHTRPHCDDHGGDRNRLVDSADLLLDCAAVLAGLIGPCAVDALSVRGIIPVEHDGPGLDGAGAVLLAIKNHLAAQPARQVLARRQIQVEEPVR